MIISYSRTGPLTHIRGRVEIGRVFVEYKHPTVLLLYCTLIALEKGTWFVNAGRPRGAAG